MKVGIIGSGAVGQALAKAFAELGNDVMMGSRDPSQQKAKEALKKAGKGIKSGTFADAAKFGEIVAFSISWSGVENAASLADPKNLEGKVVIDTVNPLDFSSGKPGLAVGGNDSAGERVQKLFPKARVVKAFNIIGADDMFHPRYKETPEMFICGNDKAAKEQVTSLLHDFGWPEVIDLGTIENARYLEALLMLRMVYGASHNWDMPAFKFVRISK